MDVPDDPRRFAGARPGLSQDPPSWVDGAPTSGVGQSCAFCGTRAVAWVHPLARDLQAYREHGTGQTLPMFWALCDRCEGVYASGDDDAAVELMRASDAWSSVADADVAECIRKPLAVFRRADRGPRRFDPEPPVLVAARNAGFVPLRELTGVPDLLGPLWPSEHRRWLGELGPSPGEDGDDGAPDRWLVRSPWPALSADQAIGALWRWVEQDPGPLAPDEVRARILGFFALTEPEAMAWGDPPP